MSLTLHTTHGNLKFQLFCEQTPLTCKNFLALCAMNAYDNTLFHRNIKSFLVQGGDRTNTGKCSESATGEPLPDEFVSSLKHDRRGMLAMANSGPNTNGSQFFITYSRCAKLNNVYPVFGKLIDGFQALDLMEREPVDSQDKPLNQIKIYKVIIHANPLANSPLQHRKLLNSSGKQGGSQQKESSNQGCSKQK